MTKYQFEFEHMEFSKDGGADELIALDRYAIPSYEGYEVGDTVVAIVKENGKDVKKVAQVTGIRDQVAVIVDRFGVEHIVQLKHLHKPLETRPAQLWDRWAKGGASVEATPRQEEWENNFRKLFDGYRYSLGGRIQLALGQEFVTGQKANLTAYNCYVAPSPETKQDPLEQFLAVLEVAFIEASIMRRGGGVGINLSTINTVAGSGAMPTQFIFYLNEKHADHEELLDRVKLGKFDGVEIVNTYDQYRRAIMVTDAMQIDAIDSVDGMFKENLTDMVSASYAGDTVVINFNALRERNAIVKGVNGRSSGATSWMELFALVARLLQQKTIDCVEFGEIYSFIVDLIIQGGSRRGALMLILNVVNAKIRKFITRKTKMGFLKGANISVGIDDEFMERVKVADRYVKSGGQYLSDTLSDALEIWNQIISSAWQSAEPGIVWLERYNKESNSWYFHEIICTNPCGEQGLPAFGVCNLGHHVLSRYFLQGGQFIDVSDRLSEYYYPQWSELVDYDVDWDSLAEGCQTAVRLQDNVIDYTPYHLKENKEVQLSERRVGIGSMALGTLLIQLELAYGSDEGNKFTEILYKFIAYQTYKASILLSKEKGAFPAYIYDKHIQSGFMKRLLAEFPDLHELLKLYGIRNVTLLTQAPTGSTATYIDNIPLFVQLFMGATTGVEPYYSWTFWRASRLGFMEQRAYIVGEYMKANGIEDEDDLPEFFVNAMDLEPEDHVRVQASVQKWTDSSISKTANCPNEYTIEQTEKLYMLSYDLGLKGMTIYRDGSREAQVLSTTKEGAKLENHIEEEKLAEMKKQEEKVELIMPVVTSNQIADTTIITERLGLDDSEIKKRPTRLYGITEKVKFPVGDQIMKAYVTINVNEDSEPIEVFIQTNEEAIQPMAQAIGRLVTQFLRFGHTSNNLEQITKHLRRGQSMATLPARVASLLEQVAFGKIEVGVAQPQAEKEAQPKKKKKVAIFQTCPDCKEKAFDKINCICTKCGSSKCN